MLERVEEGETRIELAPRIIVDPEIRFGKPVIEGRGFQSSSSSESSAAA